MSQTLWGKVDRANNSPMFGPSQVGTKTGVGTSNTANRDALFGNTTANAFTVTNVHASGVITGVYGVSAAELAEGAVGQVASVVVSSPGSGFTVRPTVGFVGGGQQVTTAVATATAKVVAVSLGGGAAAAGANYGAGDVVTIDTTGAAGASATANVNVLTVNASGSVLTLSINTAGSFTTLPTTKANNITVGGNGTGLLVNLLFGVNTVTVTGNGAGYSGIPTVTFGGAGGSGAIAVASLRSEERRVPASGWNLRKVLPNGRIQYETLVAMKITGDASDDTILPE